MRPLSMASGVPWPLVQSDTLAATGLIVVCVECPNFGGPGRLPPLPGRTRRLLEPCALDVPEPMHAHSVTSDESGDGNVCLATALKAHGFAASL